MPHNKIAKTTAVSKAVRTEVKSGKNQTELLVPVRLIVNVHRLIIVHRSQLGLELFIKLSLYVVRLRTSFALSRVTLVCVVHRPQLPDTILMLTRKLVKTFNTTVARVILFIYKFIKKGFFCKFINKNWKRILRLG